MNSNQTGKRALLIAPRFFRYEQDIASELRRRGFEIDLLFDRPFDTPLMKAVTRFGPDLVMRAATRLYREQLSGLGRSSYELILVVNGQTLSKDFLRELKMSYPGARFILYMWDSFQNRKRAVQNLGSFDRCLTFDRECASAYGLKFRPLFFSCDFQAGADEETWDYHLSFIGTIHTDRYKLVSRIAGGLPAHLRFYRYLYLQAPWVFHSMRIVNPAFRGARREEFQFVPLDRGAVRNVFFRSRAILDIEHPRQTGLTIRTLETIGASRKLVTTNARVRAYDFYRPENICVLDRTAAAVPVEFLQQPYQPIASALYYRYSLSGWMDEVLAENSEVAS
jgi:hypothetical protein